jgi:Tol biopolymer transport system component
MKRRIPALLGLLTLCVAEVALAARVPVLRQIDLPHTYYFREMVLPQLTSGPSSVAFAPDGKSVVYSMAGSLWLQAIDSPKDAEGADELTFGPGYDYQPDWSPDGRFIVFARHHADAIELWRLELSSRKTEQLTRTKAVQIQPRYSPDGSRIAFVSTAGTGHFNLYVAELTSSGLGAPRAVIAPRESSISRYYYSKHDHTINPSWTPDGKSLVFVSNRENAYGTGPICSIALEAGAAPSCFINEETSWRANPEVAPDGRRVLYSSYQGRQWHQLWVSTITGDATLPLTFGEFDITQARWSPDGRRVAYISNESGNVALWIREFTGGAKKQIVANTRKYARPMSPLTIDLRDERGQPVSGRVSIRGSDARAYAPDGAWVSADDGFDPATQSEETRYFHCSGECVVNVPLGDTSITAWRGQRYAAARSTVQVQKFPAVTMGIRFKPLMLPPWAPASVSADLHVHMNYGGHYRSTLQTLAAQARAEDLDVIYNTIVNKEQRIPDIAYAGGAMTRDGGVTIFQAQEFHTSYWGHLGLLGLRDHFLTPDFSAYQQSALTSPYPHNGAVADLAHAQGALVGYVHPFDWDVVPEKEKSLTNALPVDVALGKADYIEVVGFSDHKATAAVWHRLLNLGFRLSAGAGTDAMANYASLRGPVGMNRVYLQTGGDASAAALHEALRAGHSVASNGPLLALQVDGRNPGDTIELTAGRKLGFRAALRSLAALDHVEVLYNGRVVARHGKKHATSADLDGTINVNESGWIVLRAWNDAPDPLIFDLYPYASTSPVYVSIKDKPATSPGDAEYFLRWIDRIIASAEARQDYNDAQEKKDTMDYLRAGRAVFEKKARR